MRGRRERKSAKTNRVLKVGNADDFVGDADDEDGNDEISVVSDTANPDNAIVANPSKKAGVRKSRGRQR